MMFAFRTISRSIAVGLLALLAASQAYSQRSQLILPWQSDQERDPAEVKRIMGKIEQKEPSRDLNILWVWGIDQFHDGHKWSHEYSWAMDRYCYDLLPHVPRVTITPVYYWPSEKQWEEADLIVFYLWPHHDGASGFNDGTESSFISPCWKAVAWNWRSALDSLGDRDRMPRLMSELHPAQLSLRP